MKKVLALVAAFAVCGGMVQAGPAATKPATEQKDGDKKEAGWMDTVAGYTTKPVEDFMAKHPWFGIAGVVVATVAAEKAISYAQECYANEEEGDLDVA